MQANRGVVSQMQAALIADFSDAEIVARFLAVATERELDQGVP